MNTISRTIVGACAAVAVLVPTAAVAEAAPAPDAKTAAKHFTVVQTLQKAKLGACKVNKGTRWRVFGRLDTHKVSGSAKYQGSLFVTKAGSDEPVAVWRSAMIKKGKYSQVGSVYVPKTGGYSLAGGIGTANMGNGGPIAISKIRTC